MVTYFEGAQTMHTLLLQGMQNGADMPLWLAAFLAGSFAAVAMDALMLAVRLSVHSPFSMPVIVGSVLLPWGRPRERRTLGTAVHLLVGSLLGLAFWWLSETTQFGTLPVALASTIFALGLWFFLGTVVLPLARRGLMGARIDDFAWAISLLGHLVCALVFTTLLPFIFLSH